MSYPGDNFKRHNEDVKRLWRSFSEGRPTQVPVYFHMNSRMWLLNPKLNKKNYTFKSYYEDPRVALEVELKFQEWRRLKVREDLEKGLPQKWIPGWCGQNFDDAAWLGSKVIYRKSSVPVSEPILRENKKKLFDLEIPNPLKGNFMHYYWNYVQYIDEVKENFEFEGRPIHGKPAPPYISGPFTLASKLRGTPELMMDIYENPDYVHKIMDFTTRAVIVFQKEWFDFYKVKYPLRQFSFGDDTIELISPETYREFVLPYHRKILKVFSKDGPNAIHLCGRAQHHFKTLQKELNIQAFDTGFATNLSKARQNLGKGVVLVGNIHVDLLKRGPKWKIKEAVRDLLRGEVTEGGRFILSDGNNVAPSTPLEHLNFMYEIGKKYGKYSSAQYLTEGPPLCRAYLPDFPLLMVT